MSRRLNFLHYILNLEKTDLLSNFFKCQTENPKKGDWILTVIEDLEEFKINMHFNNIKIHPRLPLKILLKMQQKIKLFNIKERRAFENG